jgi:YVTN family beta-propeller protein
MNLNHIQLFVYQLVRHRHWHSVVRVLALVCLLLFVPSGVRTQEAVKPAPSKPEPQTTQPKPNLSAQRIVEQGVAIELTISPTNPQSTQIKAGEDVDVKFKVSDTATGTPVKGIGLSAWISMRAGDKTTDAKQCHDKIQSFLGSSMRARPDVDLNSYYVLAMNQSPDISVIDPLLGFGGSKLLALVMLKSPGEDWVLTRDGATLFVSLPKVNQVAVVKTQSWKVVEYIDTGINPIRLALQPDQKYLWVTDDKGVTVIDTGTLKVATQIQTGAGAHETVVSSDNRFAFVSNLETGTTSIIDVRKLSKIREVNVGANPVSTALSELSKAIYVGSETEGTITVIDEQSQQVLTSIKAKPGLRSIRFAPGGRYGFAVNTKENLVSVFDASSNRIVHDVSIAKGPDQVVFSGTFAFIRSLGTESISMIRLATIGTDVEITEFPGGQAAPERASRTLPADAMVLAPEGNAVVVANAADKLIYYYTEGMAAPMGSFQNYKREPLSILIVDRSLRERDPGVYSTTIKLPGAGTYDVAFLADSPRLAHCFETSAAVNPALRREATVALRIEHQIKEMKIPVGKNLPLRFKLIDSVTDKSKVDLTDVRVLTLLAPGTWQRRDPARSLGDGLYEVVLNVPEPGFYMIFVDSASMRVQFRDLPYITLEAVQENVVPPSASGQANTKAKP